MPVSMEDLKMMMDFAEKVDMDKKERLGNLLAMMARKESGAKPVSDVRELREDEDVPS